MDKDYYKILDITITAEEQDIKKAYRHLVMKYHPDRNEGNRLAEEYFKEVQEAYEILSHPGKRSAYNQQRWYRSSSVKENNAQVITPYNILQKCRKLNRYLSTIDSFHVNQQALNNYILQLLSEDVLQILAKEHDKSFGEFIIKELLTSANQLPLKSIQKISGLLLRLAGNNNDAVYRINQYLKNKKFSTYWDRYLPLIVLIITILLCLLIYFVSK